MNKDYTQFEDNIFITRDQLVLALLLEKTPFGFRDLFDSVKDAHQHFMGKNPLSCEGDELVYATKDGKHEIAIYNDGFNANIKVNGMMVGYKPFEY